MKRRQLVELEDLPWWPRTFRDFATDYLAASMRVARAHEAVVPRSAPALTQARARRILSTSVRARVDRGPPCCLALRAEGIRRARSG